VSAIKCNSKFSLVPVNFFTRAAFNVRGAFRGDYSDGVLMASFCLGTTNIRALVHVDDALRHCTYLQCAAIQPRLHDDNPQDVTTYQPSSLELPQLSESPQERLQNVTFMDC